MAIESPPPTSLHEVVIKHSDHFTFYHTSESRRHPLQLQEISNYFFRIWISNCCTDNSKCCLHFISQLLQSKRRILMTGKRRDRNVSYILFRRKAFIIKCHSDDRFKAWIRTCTNTRLSSFEHINSITQCFENFLSYCPIHPTTMYISRPGIVFSCFQYFYWQTRNLKGWKSSLSSSGRPTWSRNKKSAAMKTSILVSQEYEPFVI